MSPQEHAECAEGLTCVQAGTAKFFSGYTIARLRFANGHVLVLRHWTTSSAGIASTSVWHQYPDNSWRLYTSVLEATPPARHSVVRESFAVPIRLCWSDAYRLRVDVRSVGLEWEIDFRDSPGTRALSWLSSVMPESFKDKAFVRRMIEWVGKAVLGTDSLCLSDMTPDGDGFLVMPAAIWKVEDARAWQRGISLGKLLRTTAKTRVDGLSADAAGVLIFGNAVECRTDTASN